MHQNLKHNKEAQCEAEINKKKSCTKCVNCNWTLNVDSDGRRGLGGCRVPCTQRTHCTKHCGLFYTDWKTMLTLWKLRSWIVLHWRWIYCLLLLHWFPELFHNEGAATVCILLYWFPELLLTWTGFYWLDAPPQRSSAIRSDAVWQLSDLPPHSETSWQTWSDSADLDISQRQHPSHPPLRHVMADPGLTSPSDTLLRSPTTPLTLSFPLMRERSQVWEEGRDQPLPGELPSPLPTKRTRTYSA